MSHAWLPAGHIGHDSGKTQPVSGPCGQTCCLGRVCRVSAPPEYADKLLPALSVRYFLQVWTLPFPVPGNSTNRLPPKPSVAEEPANLVLGMAWLLSCKLGFKDSSASTLPHPQVGQDTPQRQQEPFSFPASSAPSGRAAGAAGPTAGGCARPQALHSH